MSILFESHIQRTYINLLRRDAEPLETGISCLLSSYMKLRSGHLDQSSNNLLLNNLAGLYISLTPNFHVLQPPIRLAAHNT